MPNEKDVGNTEISNPSYSAVLLAVGHHRGIVRIHDFQFASTTPARAVLRFQRLMPSAAVLSAFTEKLPELCLVRLNASSRRFAGRGKPTLSKSPNRVGDFEHE